MIKKHVVWLTCEQWMFDDGSFQESLSSDFAVYPTLFEAEKAWSIKSNERNKREGCKVTPSFIKDYKRKDVIIKSYVYTNEKGETNLIRTTFVKKTYLK